MDNQENWHYMTRIMGGLKVFLNPYIERIMKTTRWLLDEFREKQQTLWACHYDESLWLFFFFLF